MAARIESAFLRNIVWLASLVLLLIAARSTSRAQSESVTIRVNSESIPKVRVEGQRAPGRFWSFRTSYAGVGDLEKRISGLKLTDSAGKEIVVRELRAGEFETAEAASHYSYEVNLSPPNRSEDAVFVSWLNSGRGLLLPEDLLPLLSGEMPSSISAGGSGRLTSQPQRHAVKLRILLPDGWRVESANLKTEGEYYEVGDAANSVFVVGKSLRVKRNIAITGRGKGLGLNLIVAGDWSFSDDDVMDLAGKVLAEHARFFAGVPTKTVSLNLIAFPNPARPENWSAEARGTTVTILLGRQPSRNAALAQLSVPLTHELFHLWVPNALALEGDYSWFFEGFTSYAAARAAVRLQALTFEEFLGAMARAFDAYRLAADGDRFSLIDASRQRWTNESVIYQKAMLIAFLYDLQLRNESGGKLSIEDVFRDLMNRYGTSAKSKTTNTDGNTSVVAVLGKQPAMENFATTFIQRPVAIDLALQLARFGLQVDQVGQKSRIGVRQKLSKQQRDLLRQLGYNDRVRTRVDDGSR